MTKHMDMANTNMQMELLILESGWRTNNMGQESKNGRMEQGMKVNINMEKNMETENLLLLTEVRISASLEITRSLEWASMFGQMGKHMKENGTKIRCMEKELSYGLTANDTRANF